MSYETFPANPYNEASYNQSNLPPRYQRPPPWIPPKERVGHPDYDNNLSKFLLRSVKFRRSKSNEQLGFSIRGGADYGCRIYISGVIPESVAYRVGMKPGDLILSINGIDFSNVTYDEAIKVLKNLDEVEARLKYCPHGYYKTYERTGEVPPVEEH
ncbi:PDZ domain-containing protein 11-like [Lytechinus variegatus]|uniref:PDZ domain-containing protein 11-like n=1 Tax=Lytechinus variegatus TaxID=7654 RepID=UPI001BB1DFBC|nr:PDZ domain-containing protein 11-like [Lytechinus variegatus]